MPPILGTLVMVNLNGGTMVLDALDSVFAQTVAARLRVVVVDNASGDGSPERIARRFGDRVRLVRAPRNLGFAAGNNLGFREADGRYLFLLNNDAVADARWAEALVAAAESDSHIGMCTSKIVAADDPGRIDCVGHMLYPDGLNRSRGNGQRDIGQYDRPEETLFASGCAALYLREPVLGCGGFDEDFFAYGDDADLGLKLRLAGFTCLYVPTAVVRHHGSVSTREVPAAKLFLIERNRVWVLLKYLPWTWVMASPWHTARRLAGSLRAARRGTGRAGELARRASLLSVGGAILRAWLAAVWGAPRMVAKRVRLRRMRRIPPREFRALLHRFRPTPDEMSFG